MSAEVKLGSMYELTENFKKAVTMIDEDGVITEEGLALISETKMDITQKTENIFKILRFLEMQETMMKDEKKYIDGKRKTLGNNIERIKNLMQLGLDTVGVEVDKKGKKSQKVKTLKGSIYYTFKNLFNYNNEEIESKYIIKEKKLRLSDEFTFEKLQAIAPELVTEEEIVKIDKELLEFEYERAEKEGTKLPKGITKEEKKTICFRK